MKLQLFLLLGGLFVLGTVATTTTVVPNEIQYALKLRCHSQKFLSSISYKTLNRTGVFTNPVVPLGLA
jgi:hypothetical protein